MPRMVRCVKRRATHRTNAVRERLNGAATNRRDTLGNSRNASNAIMSFPHQPTLGPAARILADNTSAPRGGDHEKR